MRHGSLFSGIGGFDLAAEWMGWTNVFHCEFNHFGQRVLKHYWPNSISYGDIKLTDFTIHRGQIDVLSGGFPCQPFSTAGKRKGTEDDRHLWPEMLRAVREIQPRYVVGENVRGLTNWSGGLVFDQVQADLEAEGYEVLPFLLPACAVNAPHRRDRVWFVAYSDKCSKESSRKSGRTSGQGSNHNDEPQEWREQTEQHIGCIDVLQVDTNTSSMGRQRRRREGSKGRQDVRTETDLQRNDKGLSQSGPTPDTGSIGQQGSSRAERPRSTEALRDWKASWSYDDGRWPTQPPIRTRDDGFSRQLVRFVESEFYGTISENDRIQNVQEVWERVSSEEVWDQVRGLYSLERKDVLLQTMQLYQAGSKAPDNLSPFSAEFHGPIMQKLRKYGKFGGSPHGQELEKQRQKQFENTLSFLPHEVALASGAFETQLAKFDAWHRKESIMAYGNAIVPAVALEIFKAIVCSYGKGC